jgi:hypothetical protein
MEVNIGTKVQRAGKVLLAAAQQDTSATGSRCRIDGSLNRSRIAAFAVADCAEVVNVDVAKCSGSEARCKRRGCGEAGLPEECASIHRSLLVDPVLTR